MKRLLTFAAAALAAVLFFAGCGSTAAPSGSGSASSGPLTGMQFMVPNSPGGGYDTTARAATKVMEDNKITQGMEVTNVTGAGGTVGLGRTVSESGNGKLMMMMGLGVVGAQYTNNSTAKLDQTTPIAKLVEDAGTIVVPKNSPYQTINDLVTAWKADPTNVSVGGGSSKGGPDHLFPMQLAQTVGIDPKSVNYIAYDGGGELLPAVLGGKVAFASSSFGEFRDQVEASELRVLAVGSADRMPAIPNAPTLTESGINLVFTNWRGVVAPPNISDADRQAMISAFEKMAATQEWKDTVAELGLTESLVTGDEFGSFMKGETDRVANTLTTLGLA